MDSVNLGSPTSTSHLVGPASGMASTSNTSAAGANKYSRLPNESDSPGHGGNGAFGRAMQQQQQLVRDQVNFSMTLLFHNDSRSVLIRSYHGIFKNDTIFLSE